ncbi:MAG: double zinc ribbon domain-containing protein [Rhodospirillales bacterium]|nr:double zinc ribbon domain-containing protein [Rhodospirillales bacterium]
MGIKDRRGTIAVPADRRSVENLHGGRFDPRSSVSAAVADGVSSCRNRRMGVKGMVGSAMPGSGFLRRLPRRALDVVLPPQCLGCEAIVDEAGALCPRCWNAIQFIAEPVCWACGFPFAYALGGHALCGACIREPPLFARARAAFVYDDASRRLVLTFKHGDRTDAAPAFAEWMARAGAELLADAHVIAPVPLHWTRLFQRRYN